MASRSIINFTMTPARVRFPHPYNAASDLIDGNLEDGRGARTAVIDDAGAYSYSDLARHVNRAGNSLIALGLERGDRIALCLYDSIAFPALFWGAIKAGLVPVPLNTLLPPQDFAFVLADCGARVLVAQAAVLARLQGGLDTSSSLEWVIACGGEADGCISWENFATGASDRLAPAPTCAEDTAFLLYSSGSTGEPKGVIHRHAHPVLTAALYAVPVLGLTRSDVLFSAAKLYFAYGLGNAMSFPFFVGGTVVLTAERPTSEWVMEILQRHRPTVLFGVPTLYGTILADLANDRSRSSPRLRLCVSAGEALPEALGRAWERRFGVPVLDGLGSTELLHIFLSNTTADLRYGMSGKPVPGYEVRIIDEQGEDALAGIPGELLVKGPTVAAGYWNKPARSRVAFRDGWFATGDMYIHDMAGFYRFCGRADDMFKVSGQWASPFEIESVLLQHDAVLEAAVVGAEDGDGLVKPKAFVVLKAGVVAPEALGAELKRFVKRRIAPHKYPRWIEFVPRLPKTATGKIQRFRLRSAESEDR